jgi:hypothetical protein
MQSCSFRAQFSQALREALRRELGFGQPLVMV